MFLDAGLLRAFLQDQPLLQLQDVAHHPAAQHKEHHVQREDTQVM
ncbi:Uncharacterised protein [Mycobacteroides abscessus subsp. abscessus]|nr:Uncharacterised protein [Mycobacteroides abscessus subsp. abscessus]